MLKRILCLVIKSKTKDFLDFRQEKNFTKFFNIFQHYLLKKFNNNTHKKIFFKFITKKRQKVFINVF